MYILLDTEFTDFDSRDVISVGMVSECGGYEFYSEVSDHNPNLRTQFVNQVVMPLLQGGDVSVPYAQSAERMSNWLTSLPQDQGDLMVLVDYIGDWLIVDCMLRKFPIKRPIRCQFINYALDHIIKERGITAPEVLTQARINFDSGCQHYYTIDSRQHHALVDAKSNRVGWLAGKAVLNV